MKKKKSSKIDQFNSTKNIGIFILLGLFLFTTHANMDTLNIKNLNKKKNEINSLYTHALFQQQN
jgi:hypothetical protein